MAPGRDQPNRDVVTSDGDERPIILSTLHSTLVVIQNHLVCPC
jgi:hypothetical protein